MSPPLLPPSTLCLPSFLFLLTRARVTKLNCYWKLFEWLRLTESIAYFCEKNGSKTVHSFSRRANGKLLFGTVSLRERAMPCVRMPFDDMNIVLQTERISYCTTVRWQIFNVHSIELSTRKRMFTACDRLLLGRERRKKSRSSFSILGNRTI